MVEKNYRWWRKIMETKPSLQPNTLDFLQDVKTKPTNEGVP